MQNSRIVPTDSSRDAMWSTMESLFPRYRALCGPDFRASLEIIGRSIPLSLTNIPSGTKINGWTVPKEFMPHEAWIKDLKGRTMISFADHPYHLKLYSQPFRGTVDRDTLLSKLGVSDTLPDAIPLRHCYYVNDWGFCATHAQRDSLRDARYEVLIDVEHLDGHLTIGETYLPGRSRDEILFTSYLCHPRGANDNLSGIVIAAELMRLISLLPERRYSYRLILNPETIGSLAWIHSDPERTKRLIGGYEISICGDPSPVRYFASIEGDALIDRAGELAVGGLAVPHTFMYSGCDQAQFNAPGVRVPFGRWGRAGPANYAAYHTSADDLDLVRPDQLIETLTTIWRAIMAIERNDIYAPNYVGLPSLSARGVYPYRHYSGDGSPQVGTIASAYYELLGWVDGRRDLIEIARRTNLPMDAFDEAVLDFLRVGLIRPA